MSTELAAAATAGPLTFADVMASAAPAPLPPVTETLTRSPETIAAVAAALKEVDLDRPETLVSWGANAQARLGEVSSQLIALTKVKDSGPVGAALASLVMQIRGFDIADIQQGDKVRGGLMRLFRKAALPVAIALQRYQTVEDQVNQIVRNLDAHIGRLMRDVVALERIYRENVTAYETVKVYIEAGKLLIDEIDGNRLPKLRAEARSDDQLAGQRIARLTATRERLERRLADLVLTRTVLFQGLPAVALIEDNDTNLIERVQSTIANAVPLWKQRIAMLIAQRNGMEAARAQGQAVDLANELLVDSAKILHNSTTQVRVEVERGLFDADKVRAANDEIVASLEDAMRLYDQGRERRRAAIAVADACEIRLRQAMEGIRGVGPTAGAPPA